MEKRLNVIQMDTIRRVVEGFESVGMDYKEDVLDHRPSFKSDEHQAEVLAEYNQYLRQVKYPLNFLEIEDELDEVADYLGW